MSSLNSKIESILFVASKPLSISNISKSLGVSNQDVEESMEEITIKFNSDSSGIYLSRVGDTVQFSTNINNTDDVEHFVKYDISLELTKAQLETLTIIAYEGPVTRPEIEEIRGVNCALILRNLLIRGLITESEVDDKIVPIYSLSMEAMLELGINNVTELKDYDTFHNHEHLILENKDE